MTSDEKLVAKFDAAQRDLHEREEEMRKAREEYDRAMRRFERARSELSTAFEAMKLYHAGVK